MTIGNQHDPALVVENVSHAFGSSKALSDVSVSVEAGKICGLLGLNGAGKTTLFSLITRLYDNTSGSIRGFGHDVRGQPSQALRQLGVVFQSRTLDNELSVEQNLLYHASLHGLPRSVADERISTGLERSGLAEQRKKKVRQLSGGQLRRVEIARSLLHKPKLLLLDEPTVGLDINARQDIINHVRELVRTDNLAVLWATHLFDEITAGNMAFVLHKGKVLASGSYAQILESGNSTSLLAAFKNLTSTSDQELLS